LHHQLTIKGRAMPRMIFITLPVTDVAKSRRFYEALGFMINEKFSDPTTTCVVVSDTIYFMIQTHERFQSFSTKPLILPSTGTMSLITLSCDSRAEVDAMTEAALKSGGKELHGAEDLGFMYSRAFEDPDGNGFGPMWMNPAAAGG
jgi:predicted lactoylglutathione lyase